MRAPFIKRSTGGFTLVELMVTVVILAILLAIGVPSITNLLRDARLSGQADQLVGILKAARIEAIKERKDYTVCPSAAPDTATVCSTTLADWSSGVLIWDGTTVVRRASVAQGVTVTFAATTVVFRGTIGSSPAAGTITVCATGRTEQQIDITLSGRVSKRINSGTTCS